MTQTSLRKQKVSQAAKNAQRIRSAKNSSRLDLAIKTAEVEATVVRTVPLLFHQLFPQGSRVFSYEDQTCLLLRMEPDGSYYPMVPTTNVDRSQAQMIAEERMPAATEAQVFTHRASLSLERAIQVCLVDARRKLQDDPSEENHAALRRLTIEFTAVLSELAGSGN